MSVEFWVTAALVPILGALIVMAMREALSERSRARIAAVYRFFVKPRAEKEVPDEPSR